MCVWWSPLVARLVVCTDARCVEADRAGPRSHRGAAHFVERYIGGRPCLYDAKHYEPRKLRNAKYARYDVNTTRWHKFQGKGICEENVSTRGACAKIKWLCFNGNLSWTERDFPYAVAHGMYWQVFRSFALHFVRSFYLNPTLTLPYS